MNYTREQCDEARRRFVDGQPWEKIVEVFATVPQVTLEEAVQIRSEYYRRVGPEGIKTAQEIMQQVVNAVLAKRGTGIAAKPADGIITEDALSIALYALQELACFGNGNSWGNSKGNMIAIRALKKIGSPTKPEPTVTLVDAAEGLSLEVPVSAVHEMEYPEAITYSAMKPNYRTSVCDSCGAVVVDQALHGMFHEREAR